MWVSQKGDGGEIQGLSLVQVARSSTKGLVGPHLHTDVVVAADNEEGRSYRSGVPGVFSRHHTPTPAPVLGLDPASSLFRPFWRMRPLVSRPIFVFETCGSEDRKRGYVEKVDEGGYLEFEQGHIEGFHDFGSGRPVVLLRIGTISRRVCLIRQ